MDMKPATNEQAKLMERAIGCFFLIFGIVMFVFLFVFVCSHANWGYLFNY